MQPSGRRDKQQEARPGRAGLAADSALALVLAAVLTVATYFTSTELLKQKPRTASALNYLGGTTMPCAANLQIPLESAPGTYTFVCMYHPNMTGQLTVI